jgi:hypothetical protein
MRHSAEEDVGNILNGVRAAQITRYRLPPTVPEPISRSLNKADLAR